MMKIYNIIRLLFGVIFILGAFANTYMLITMPEVYRDFAADSFLVIYKQLWQTIVYPNLSVFVKADHLI